MAERIYGPVVASSESEDEADNDEIGEASANRRGDGSYGPVLPPDFVNQQSTSANYFGPPMPVPSSMTTQQLQLEKRALELKLKNYYPADSTTPNTGREEWMTELPDIVSKTGLGLTTRSFRQREGPDYSDRSAWTRNPTTEPDSSRRPIVRLKIKDPFSNDPDRDHILIAKKLKKKHKKEKSLMEIHQKKKKKDKKKKSKKDKEAKEAKEERRPFNRETDMQANTIDDGKKKAIIKQAQLLDTRFASGSETKYL